MTYEGKIRKKVEAKGFGFITLSDGTEAFFHARQCVTLYDRLQEGDRVRFDTESTDKGLRAVKVVKS